MSTINTKQINHRKMATIETRYLNFRNWQSTVNID